PFETTPCRGVPEFVASDGECLQTGGDHGVRLQRLLIETRLFTAALPKAVAADRREMPIPRRLRGEQPAQRGEADVQDLRLRSPMTAEDHGVGKLGIVVRGNSLEPRPVG